MEACPSNFALDDAEIHGGPATAGVARHFDECERCRTRGVARSALGSRFDSALAQPLWNRVDVARRQRARSWGQRFRLAAPLLVGAAAVVVLVARRPETYRATKGDLTVEIAARRGESVFAVDPATEVNPGDQLQFTVRSAHAAVGRRYVLVGSVDGTGKFSVFYPASVDGRSVALPAGGAPLAPPIVLDDAPGPERIVVVISERPIAARVVAPLVESGASAPDLVAALGGGDMTARWFVLAKRDRPRTKP